VNAYCNRDRTTFESYDLIPDSPFYVDILVHLVIGANVYQVYSKGDQQGNTHQNDENHGQFESSCTAAIVLLDSTIFVSEIEHFVLAVLGLTY
jgi:hypothetical protein